MNRRICSSFATVCLATLAAAAVQAFEQPTHEVLSESGVEQSSLDDFLKSNFPEYWQGIKQTIGPNGEPVVDLIADGSHDEDEPAFPRVFWHFHDPTKSWDRAGLLGGLFASSIYRQQETESRYMWAKAREAYLSALLATTAEDRESSWQETFWSLGHLAHFVQDAASPAHTRDDPHLVEDGLHTWAAGLDRDGVRAITEHPISFSGDLASATSDSKAPRPFARLIDATEEDRGAPAWSSDIGVAEYSNSQFLSDDRMFGENGYIYPRFDSMQAVDASYEGVVPGSRRHYLQFPVGSPEGESDYFVAAQLPLYRNSPNRRFYLTQLTDRVLEDYARKLLPRAVVYSASLIDHFFRGKIDITPPDRFVYGRTTYEEGNTTSFRTLGFKVANGSPSGHETSGEGSLWAVVQYRTSTANLFDDPGAPISAEVESVVSQEARVSLTRTPQEVRFDFEAGEIPANMADVRLLVVYAGQLGGEPDAVLIGTVDLAEPHPIDFFNATDYDCVNQQPYYVANLAPDDSARDLDGDGDSDLLGPYGLVELHWKVSLAPGSILLPTSSFYDFFVPEASVSEGFTPTTRYVTLHDGDYIWKAARIGEERSEHGNLLAQDDVWVFNYPSASRAILNETFRDAEGNLQRRYSPAGTYRGVRGFTMTGFAAHRDHFVEYCFYPLRDAPPDLTRIPGTLAPEE